MWTHCRSRIGFEMLSEDLRRRLALAESDLIAAKSMVEVWQTRCEQERMRNTKLGQHLREWNGAAAAPTL